MVIRYDFVSKEDTSYANYKRGSIKIKILGDQIPEESELKDLAVSAWTAHRDWPNGRVFVFVKDMPTNVEAYAIAEFERSRLKQFTVNRSALEVHEYLKKQR